MPEPNSVNIPHRFVAASRKSAADLLYKAPRASSVRSAMSVGTPSLSYGPSPVRSGTTWESDCWKPVDGGNVIYMPFLAELEEPSVDHAIDMALLTELALPAGG